MIKATQRLYHTSYKERYHLDQLRDDVKSRKKV
jgi:hypothetical protein